MQNIAKRQGFSLVRQTKIDELDATLYELRHIKTDAELIYIDRDDENKTFAIAFTTPPKDSTGVFHIIEHSVLCGSQKYPLKDPFAELLKGSLNTFLNALTYEDRTVYPVSSRCEKDFQGLVDVYLDAVFAPKLLENPSIFSQEGWHYEYNKESDTLSYNGVVYNEMKGVYSSPDEVGEMELSRALYSDSIYRHDSGGNPDCIPDLTYEQFKATHKKHYHPTNAKIIIDGKMDVEAVLSIIDSHISRFERGERVAPPKKSEERIAPTEYVRYEISENEDENGRARVLFGYVYSDYSDKVAHLTATILADLLCGSNASPLKKALLDKGLCKDAVIYTSKSLEQTVTLEIRDTDKEKLGEIEKTVDEVVRGLATAGIDKSRLTSIINNIEFKLRERDYGTLPSGIAYSLSAFGSWIYGGKPEDALIVTNALTEIRKKVDSDYFEKALLEMTVDNPHRATVVMLPDKSLAKEVAIKEKERLETIRKSLSNDELAKIEAAESELRRWQASEESEEELACLPRLEISDIPKKTASIKSDEFSVNGINFIKNKVKTNGIIYISMYFDASDLSSDELTTLSLLSAALLNFPTESHDVLALQSDIKANLGSFFISTYSAKKNGAITPYLKVGASALASKCDDIIRIAKEVLTTSKINDAGEISSIIAQAKSQIEDAIITSGESLALSRVEASLGGIASVNEYMTGYEAYKVLSRLAKSEELVKEETEKISALLSRIIAKNRLTVSITGECDQSFPERLVSIFPVGDEFSRKKNEICADKSEFFVIPSKVAYAVIGGCSDEVRENLGLMRVVRSILSYEYLWNTVRVKNGAYGTGFVPRREGMISFYSYRDPAPASSIEYYRESSSYLRTLAESGCDLTKFIIGAIGEYDVLITPRTASALATQNYLTGWTDEDDLKVRNDMLSVTPAGLIKAADIIDRLLDEASMTVVGSDRHLGSLPEKPARIITI
ncbi:MAG: insulinase family protein [Clostridia bacterium]|nr:insulinase family protein [Clostridia bacterium]